MPKVIHTTILHQSIETVFAVLLGETNSQEAWTPADLTGRTPAEG